MIGRVICCSSVTVALLTVLTPAVAQEDQAATELPLREVVLLNSGVGFFEKVPGNGRVYKGSGSHRCPLSLLKGGIESLVAVLFLPFQKKAETKSHKNLLQMARSAGLPLESVCGGKKICGKCRVTPFAAKDSIAA